MRNYKTIKILHKEAFKLYKQDHWEYLGKEETQKNIYWNNQTGEIIIVSFDGHNCIFSKRIYNV